MNRSIALFVALVTLLAHTLAIHNDGAGHLAFPYDQAYVAFRLARNLVFEHQLAWNPGMQAFESYPSVMWLCVCAVGERLSPLMHVSMNVIAQTIGIGSMLLAVVLCARFRSDRNASLIAPLLLATSGCIAAAAANGLETALFTLSATAAFLELERGHAWRMAIALCVCCLTRPEGCIFAFALLAVRVLGKPNDDEGEAKIVPIAAFLLPLCVVAGSAMVRWRTTGFVLPPVASAFLAPRPGQWHAGAQALRDFLFTTLSPLLLVFPAWYLVKGELSRTGAHAIFLALAWTAAVAAQGRPTLPFYEALAPALPFIFLGVQEGMIVALDGLSRLVRRVALLALGVCLAGSALASKSPGDLGPIPFGQWHLAWMAPSGSARFGYEGPLGRLGLEEEIERTILLRKAGLFLRDQVEPGVGILTPWPGSIGYLSRQPVYDVLGRTDPQSPLDRPRTWSRLERADVVESLAQDVDYVVPLCTAARRPLSQHELAELWMQGLDEHASEPGRIDAIEKAFSRYELITVPIYDYAKAREPREGEPFYLLRNRRLEQRPHLEMRVEGRRFRVTMFHKSHQQIADLRVQIKDSRGRTFTFRPTGDLADSSTVRARTAILLYDSGTRGIEVMRAELPDAEPGLRWTELRAVLRNPEAKGEDPFAFESDEIVVPLGS